MRIKFFLLFLFFLISCRGSFATELSDIDGIDKIEFVHFGEQDKTVQPIRIYSYGSESVKLVFEKGWVVYVRGDVFKNFILFLKNFHQIDAVCHGLGPYGTFFITWSNGRENGSFCSQRSISSYVFSGLKDIASRYKSNEVFELFEYYSLMFVDSQ